MIPGPLHALASYLRVRLTPWRFRDRSALLRWQKRRIARWLARDVPRVPAFAGMRPARLEELPVMDKSLLMADFARYNREGITNEQGWAAFAGSRQIGDLILGASTGTSGNRGLFVISQAERFAWLGAILAKALPDVWRHRDRVAVLLPLDTPLYDSANHSRRLTLRFFDISRPLEELRPPLEAFAPTVLIAPPRILRRLAESDAALAPRRVFSGAEKLDPIDREIIEQRFGFSPGEIYMATEGLLAVTCGHGRLHLAEDCLHFEFEPAGNGLVSPLLSDFSRRTQIMARYRLNDLLALDDSPCPCGSPLMGLREVVGRQDDVFLLPGNSGETVEMTPDILRNAVVDTDRAITDFALVQTGPAGVELHLPPVRITLAPAVLDRLRALFDRHGITDGVTLTAADLPPHTSGKLRRIRRA